MLFMITSNNNFDTVFAFFLISPPQAFFSLQELLIGLFQLSVNLVAVLIFPARPFRKNTDSFSGISSRLERHSKQLLQQFMRKYICWSLSITHVSKYTGKMMKWFLSSVLLTRKTKPFTYVKVEQNTYKHLVKDTSWLLRVQYITVFSSNCNIMFLCCNNNVHRIICKLFFVNCIDHSKPAAAYVNQTPGATAVRLGDAMTLQCSLLHSQETSSQCPESPSVIWFKAGSGNSLPSIIYTHRNSTGEDTGRSCVYRLSKTLQDSSDFGTYYCAVVICGEILFGNGTQLETSMY